MIVFKRVKYKNIASVGNDPIEIELDKNKKTLIIGSNGSSKSTTIDALCFALYGKYFKNANKNTLINNVNGKNLETEVEFVTNGKNYFIKRGLKPNIFEIYMDDVLINQTASSKDYQKYLEENILHLNYNSFKQIVVLGSNNYVPFMRLTAAARREMIEELLDISVFSRMNVLLKERIQETKEQIKTLTSSIQLEKEKYILNEKFLHDIKKTKEDKTDQTKADIEMLLKENEKNTNNVQSLLVRLSEYNEKNEKFGLIETKSFDIERDHKRISDELTKTQKNIKFFEDNDYCPTCKQTINLQFKTNEIDKHKHILSDFEIKVKDVSEKLKTLTDVMKNRKTITDAIRNINTKISNLQTSIQTNQKMVSRLEKELNDPVDISKEEELEDTLSKLKKIIKSLVKQKDDIKSQSQTESMVYLLLKDNGLKTAIIKKYIPYINKTINEFLQLMEFYTSFELDENFKETIKSRYTENSSYDQLSEGEKQRVDLSILLAWRQIARMKNSMATNLLIMDEIFDSSLDEEGIKYVSDIFNTLGKDTNIFVISHRENMVEQFDRVLKFSKKGNFSTVEEL